MFRPGYPWHDWQAARGDNNILCLVLLAVDIYRRRILKFGLALEVGNVVLVQIDLVDIVQSRDIGVAVFLDV